MNPAGAFVVDPDTQHLYAAYGRGNIPQRERQKLMTGIMRHTETANRESVRYRSIKTIPPGLKNYLKLPFDVGEKPDVGFLTSKGTSFMIAKRNVTPTNSSTVTRKTTDTSPPQTLAFNGAGKTIQGRFCGRFWPWAS